MKFRIVWVGSNSDAEFREAIDRYFNRIKHFFPIEVIEVAAEKDRQKKSDASIMHAESARLKSAIPSRGVTVVMDERGDAIDSLKFARWLERITIENPYGVTFVLGGDLGIDPQLRNGADRVLALSAMTLPHQVARLVLMEQIYRACTLMRNIAYHK